MLTRLLTSSKVRLIFIVFAVDLIFFGLVNPASSHSFVVIAGSLLLAITIYIVVRMATLLFGVFVPVTEGSQRRLAIFLTVVSMFLLLMQSIGQLSLKDVLAIAPLVLVSYLYMGYASNKSSNKG